MSNKKLLILMFLFFILLRLLFLDADPPMDLSPYNAPFTDEAFYAQNARNEVLFGNQIFGEYNTRYLTPLQHLLNLASFKIFGVGYIQARAISVIFSIFLLFLLYLTLRDYNEKTALIAILFLGINFVFLMFNRLALSEVILMFFYVLTLFFFQKAIKTDKLAYFSFFGASSFLTYANKAVAVYFLGVCFFVWFVWYIKMHFNKRSFKDLNKKFLYFLIGFFIVFILWLIFIKIPSGSEVSKFISFHFVQYGPPLSVEEFIWSMVTFFGVLILYFVIKMPVISFLFLLYLGYLLKNIKKIKDFDLFLLIWFLFGFFFFFFFLKYSPPRYILFFIIIFSICAAKSLELIPKILPKKNYKKIILFLILLSLSINFFQYGIWVSNLEYKLQDLHKGIKINDNSVIAGPWAPAIFFETEYKTMIIIENFVNDKREIYEENDVTHFLLDEKTKDFMLRKFPDIIADSILIKEFGVKNKHLELYWWNPKSL